MPVQFEVTDRSAHNELPPRKKPTQRDPQWEEVMDVLQNTDNTVRVPFADEKERGTLARSIGRRAAHRGFKVEIRYGEGFLSVARSSDAILETPASLAARPNRRRRRAAQIEVVNGPEPIVTE